MEILVNGEVKELEIVDQKTGCHWERDLLGNADILGYDDEMEMPTLDEDEFEWWANYIETQQDIDDRIHALRSDLDNDDAEKFDAELIEVVDGEEFNDQPARQLEVLEKWEAK